MSESAMDIEGIRMFALAARVGNIGKAAERIGISQSTMSRRVAALETAIGAKLLARSSTGVTPTDVGRRVMAAAEGLDDIVDRITLVSGGLRRNAAIHVSASDGMGGYWLPICMSAFAQDHPDVCMRVSCRGFAAGPPSPGAPASDADIDLTYFEPTDPDAVVLGRGTLEMRMFGSESYLERFGTPATLEDLSDHRVCAHEDYFVDGLGDGDWDAYAALLRAHDRVTYRVNSSMALGFAVRSSWGLGVQPALVESTERGMVMLPEGVYRSRSLFWLVAHKDLKDNPAPRLVANWIKRNLIKTLGGLATFEAAD